MANTKLKKFKKNTQSIIEKLVKCDTRSAAMYGHFLQLTKWLQEAQKRINEPDWPFYEEFIKHLNERREFKVYVQPYEIGISWLSWGDRCESIYLNAGKKFEFHVSGEH